MGSFFNYQIIAQEVGTPLRPEIFQVTILNLLVFLLIFLITKILIKYSKRFFKSRELTEKQLRIEGREIALWKLYKQLIWIFSIYICFMSLRINNDSVNLEQILLIEFFRFQEFHIAVYHIFYVFAVIVISRLVLGLIKVYLLKRVSHTQHLDKGTEYVVVTLAKYVIYSISIILIIRAFGINLGLLLSSLAFLLVGIGLGLQDLFKDFFSGFVLLIESKVKVGDVIEILNQKEEENLVAIIKEINLRTSKVETNDGKMLIIPNSKLTNDTVNNWSFGDGLTRFMIPVTVHYGSDLEQIQQILLKCANGHKKVSTTNLPIVRLLKFGHDGIELDLVFWADQNLYIEILKSEIRFEVYKEFQKAGIQIPYPQRDLHIIDGTNNPLDTSESEE